MTADEFITAADKSGYGGKVAAEKYVARSGKSEFTANDHIALYRACNDAITPGKGEKWRNYQGVTSTKRLIDIGSDKYD